MAVNSMKDLLICGTCKNMFSEVKLFLEHKNTCSLPDGCVDSRLLTSQCDLDLTDLENGVLPLILQFDKADTDISVLEECSLQESEDVSCSKRCKVKTSENGGIPFLTDHWSKEVNSFDWNAANSSIINELSEVNEAVVKSTEEDSTNKEEKNACGICDFVTIRRHDLIRHMLKHSGDRPYDCNICDKKFARKDKLLTHKRIHYGNKRYKCQFCKYASTDGTALRTHLRIHLDKRPYKCQICTYKARNSSHLTVHLRIHTGDSPFICQLAICGRAFKTSSDLKRHMKVHKRKNLAAKHPSIKTLPETIASNNLVKNENLEKKTSSCFGCKDFRHKGLKRKRRGRPRRSVAAVCVKLHECPRCSASFVRLDSLHSHLRQHPRSSTEETCPTSNDPTEDQPVEPSLYDQEVLFLDNFVTTASVSDS